MVGLRNLSPLDLRQRLAILFQLLGKHEKLVAALTSIVLFRHLFLPLALHLFTGQALRSLDLRLQSSLFFQGTTRKAFLHAFQGEVVIVEPGFLLR